MKASLLFLLLAALPLGAWGDKGHRTVSALALTTLPPAPRAWFAGQESVLVDHASDPDHWKTDKKEGPRHYMNLEAFGGAGGRVVSASADTVRCPLSPQAPRGRAARSRNRRLAFKRCPRCIQ